MSTRMSIATLHPTLQKAWEDLRPWWVLSGTPGTDLRLTTTYRSPEEQNRIYRQSGGRRTKLDGVTKFSWHNYRPALAFDVVVVQRGLASYDGRAYLPLRRFCRQHGGLHWGGDFGVSRQGEGVSEESRAVGWDAPHIELAATERQRIIAALLGARGAVSTALAAFQRAHKLPATGRIDPTTWAALWNQRTT